MKNMKRRLLLCGLCLIVSLSFVGCKKDKLTKEERELMIEFDELEKPVMENTDSGEIYYIEPKTEINQ